VHMCQCACAGPLDSRPVHLVQNTPVAIFKLLPFQGQTRACYKVLKYRGI